MACDPHADAGYVDAQRTGLLRWANATTYVGGLAAMNFVLHICHSRTDVRGSFPLIRGEERRNLVRSVIAAAKALGMDSGYIKPLERSLGRHWLPKGIRMRISREERPPGSFPWLADSML